MKHHTTTPLRAFVALFAILFITATSNAQTPSKKESFAPSSSSEAVLYSHGVLTAQSEAAEAAEAAEVTNPSGTPWEPTRVHAFRVLAFMNYVTASMFFDLPVAAAYFRGRADAFVIIADLLGEP